MSLNDIRNDLENDILLDEKTRKDFIVSQNKDSKNTSDITQNKPKDILLSWKNSLKISQKYKFFSRKSKHYFDPVFKSRFRKTINLVEKKYLDFDRIKEKYFEYLELYKNKNISEWFRNFYKSIPLNSTTQQKTHNFIKKEIIYKNVWNINNEAPVDDNNILISKDNLKQWNIFMKIWVIGLLLIIWLFWLKISIEENVNQWYGKLIALKDGDLNGNSLEEQLTSIYDHFKTADFLYKPISVFPNETVKNGYHVIKWWKQIWYFWNHFLDFYNSLNKKILSVWIQNIYISEFLEQNKQSFYNFEKSLSQALLHYDKVTSVWDTLMQKKFDDTMKKLHQAISYLKIVNLNFDEFLAFLWHKSPKEYLIMFQNNDEIRPTGWFSGSMGIISIYKWKVLNIKKTDVYAYEWEINKTYNSISEKLLAPEWLNKITGTWGLRDANYYPEVKKTAQEIKQFLDRIDERIDGIIFINKSTIEEILRVSWWIEFPEIWETLTDENFSRIMSTLVEAKVSKEGTLWTPKQVLFDFAERFYQEMQKNNDYVPYAKVIFKHLLSRDIMVYSFHPEENSFLWKLGINWEIPFHKTLDFSYPVYTSISWNKSDRYIKTEYEKTVKEISECHFVTDLNIIRKHQYNKVEEQKVDDLLHKFNVINKDHIRYIQWKWDNYQYMRVFLPKYAVIEQKEWMTIKQFQRYQEVSFYMKTRLYETTGYKINYSINKPNCNWYSYTLYKQPGIKEYKMSLNIFDENIFARDVQKDFFIKR